MEMEKVNENTIRVLLGTKDLTDRGITVLDLLGNQKEIENFFFSILEEVDKDHEFRDNDAVTFQLIPNQNGLELFITKVDPKKAEASMNLERDDSKESDANASPLNIANAGIGNDLADYIRKQITGENEKIRRQKPALANDGDGVSGYLKEDPEAQYRYVVSFADFEDFIQLAKAFNYDSTVSNLYHLDGKYYLELIFFADQMEVADVKDAMALVYEYGQKEQFESAVVKERGKCLMEHAALELARYHFK